MGTGSRCLSWPPLPSLDFYWSTRDELDSGPPQTATLGCGDQETFLSYWYPRLFSTQKLLLSAGLAPPGRSCADCATVAVAAPDTAPNSAAAWHGCATIRIRLDPAAIWLKEPRWDPTLPAFQQAEPVRDHRLPQLLPRAPADPWGHRRSARANRPNRPNRPPDGRSGCDDPGRAGDEEAIRRSAFSGAGREDLQASMSSSRRRAGEQTGVPFVDTTVRFHSFAAAARPPSKPSTKPRELASLR